MQIHHYLGPVGILTRDAERMVAASSLDPGRRADVEDAPRLERRLGRN
jgi:hypothetical protein